VYVNVVGGLRVTEPAVDLAVALAVASSYRDQAVPRDIAAIGEIGLAGEVRPVRQLDRRVAEAARLGFRTCLVPPSRRRAGASGRGHVSADSGVLEAESLLVAIERALGPAPRRRVRRQHEEHGGIAGAPRRHVTEADGEDEPSADLRDDDDLVGLPTEAFERGG